MSPRLDPQPTRSPWIALALATVLFLLAIVLSFARMGSAHSVLQHKDLARAGSVTTGSA